MKKLFSLLLTIITFHNLMSQNGDVGFGGNLTLPIIPYEGFCFQRNDTVFSLKIYPDKSQIDSIVYGSYATKIGKSRWKINKGDGGYTIIKYKKIKPSTWFQDNNNKLFQADYECTPRGTTKTFFPNGDVMVSRYFFKWVHTKMIKAKMPCK